MRKRKRNKGNADIQIKFLGQKWRDAVYAKDFETAKALRAEAEPIFERRPELLNKPPKRTKRMLFIEWQWFANYNNPETRDFFNRCVTDGVAANWKAKESNSNFKKTDNG